MAEPKAKDPKEWDIGDVQQWLEREGYDKEVRNCFGSNKITGENLPLGEEALQKIGISAYGDRDRLIKGQARLFPGTAVVPSTVPQEKYEKSQAVLAKYHLKQPFPSLESARGRAITTGSSIDEVGRFFSFENREKTLAYLGQLIFKRYELFKNLKSDIEADLTRLSGAEFITVLGASGIGKSTFATSGLAKLLLHLNPPAGVSSVSQSVIATSSSSKASLNISLLRKKKPQNTTLPPFFEEFKRQLTTCINHWQVVRTCVKTAPQQTYESNASSFLAYRALYYFGSIGKEISEMTYLKWLTSIAGGRNDTLPPLKLQDVIKKFMSKGIVIFVLDEVQELSRGSFETSFLRQVLMEFWSCSVTLFPEIILVPVLCGTDSLKIVDCFRKSSYNYVDVVLPTLEAKHISSIITALSSRKCSLLWSRFISMMSDGHARILEYFISVASWWNEGSFQGLDAKKFDPKGFHNFMLHHQRTPAILWKVARTAWIDVIHYLDSIVKATLSVCEKSALLWRLLSKNDKDRLVKRSDTVFAGSTRTWGALEDSGAIFLGAEDGANKQTDLKLHTAFITYSNNVGSQFPDEPLFSLAEDFDSNANEQQDIATVLTDIWISAKKGESSYDLHNLATKFPLGEYTILPPSSFNYGISNLNSKVQSREQLLELFVKFLEHEKEKANAKGVQPKKAEVKANAKKAREKKGSVKKAEATDKREEAEEQTRKTFAYKNVAKSSWADTLTFLQDSKTPYHYYVLLFQSKLKSTLKERNATDYLFTAELKKVLGGDLTALDDMSVVFEGKEIRLSWIFFYITDSHKVVYDGVLPKNVAVISRGPRSMHFYGPLRDTLRKMRCAPCVWKDINNSERLEKAEHPEVIPMSDSKKRKVKESESDIASVRQEQPISKKAKQKEKHNQGDQDDEEDLESTPPAKPKSTSKAERVTKAKSNSTNKKRNN